MGLFALFVFLIGGPGGLVPNDRSAGRRNRVREIALGCLTETSRQLGWEREGRSGRALTRCAREGEGGEIAAAPYIEHPLKNPKKSRILIGTGGYPQISIHRVMTSVQPFGRLARHDCACEQKAEFLGIM